MRRGGSSVFHLKLGENAAGKNGPNEKRGGKNAGVYTGLHAGFILSCRLPLCRSEDDFASLRSRPETLAVTSVKPTYRSPHRFAQAAAPGGSIAGS